MNVEIKKQKKVLIVTLEHNDVFNNIKESFSLMKKEVSKIPVSNYSLIVDLSHLSAFDSSEQLVVELWFELCVNFGFYNVYIVRPKNVIAKMQLIKIANICEFTGTIIDRKEEITEDDFMKIENKEDEKIIVVTFNNHALYEFTKELISLMNQKIAKVPIHDYSLIIDLTKLLAVRPIKQHTLESLYRLCMNFGFNNLYLVKPKSEITKLQLLRIAKQCDFTGTFIEQNENIRVKA